GKVKASIRVGREPEGVTLRPDERFVYVTCEGDSEVVAVSTKTLKVVSKMRTDLRPRSIAFSSDGSKAFVTDERGGAITVLDGIHHKTLTSMQVPASGTNTSPARPMGSVMAHDGKHAFISNGRGGSVAVVDAIQVRVVNLIPEVGDRPWGIAISADDKQL